MMKIMTTEVRTIRILINKKNINDKSKSNKGFFFSHYQKLSLVQTGLFTECRSLRKIKKPSY